MAEVGISELEITTDQRKIAAGELDAGIVYLSDIASDPAVDQVEISERDQQFNTYVIAPTAAANNIPLAEEFIDFLRFGEGRDIIEQFGFQAADR